MFRKFAYFVRCASINRTGLVGVVLTTSSFVTFSILELARIVGILTNAYLGLVSYLLFPSLFVAGLILIPIGWYAQKRRTGRTARQLLNERFGEEQTRPGLWGSRLLVSVGALTLVNVLFLGGVASRMLSFMDKPVFCGTACHSVMNPEWVTYQQSPHARVRCVDCHVGEGTGAFVNSKLNGMWQMISVTFDLLERPIPTPVHQLRPARETCEKCHWPDKFYGSRLKSIIRYGKDEMSTPRYTTLNLKVDAGTPTDKHGIHWHTAEENLVRYASVGDEREDMIWVESRQSDGSLRRFANRALVKPDARHEDVRELDCVDCHNRATHIYEVASHAVDERVRLGQLNRSLPFLKREAVGAITADYATKEATMEGIANHMHGFYRRNLPDLANNRMVRTEAAVSVLQDVYGRNIHHGMNITWGAYPSHIGHAGGGGCFRCHNPDLVDQGGSSIPYDCSLCHSILAYDSDEPFRFLQTPDSAAWDYPMHKYLHGEFLKSFGVERQKVPEEQDSLEQTVPVQVQPSDNAQASPDR